MRRSPAAAQPRPLSARRLTAALIPVLVAAAVILVTVVLWWRLDLHERSQIRRTLEFEAASAAREVDARVETRLFTLVRMAERWQVRRSTPKSEWENDAGLLARHFPEMQAVLWIDPAFRAAWVAPLPGNEHWLGADVGLTPSRRAALAEARDRGVVRIAEGSVEPGRASVMVAAPILGEEFGGFIGALVDTQAMLATILANVATGLNVAVSDGRHELYLSDGADHTHAHEWRVQTMVGIGGARWTLRAWPQPAWLATERSPLNRAVLLGGVALALLMGLVVRFEQIARLRSQQLAGEMAQRRAAQEKAAFLAGIVDSSHDAIIGETLAGTVASWNPGAERLYGYSAAEMIGRPLSVLFPPDHPDILHAMLEAVRRGDLIDHSEVVCLHKHGMPLHVSVTVSPVTEADGRIIGASSIGRDITRRKRAEAELKHTLERLEQSTRHQSLSLASTSHDVRGALSVIAGYSQLLARDMTDDRARDMALRIAGLAYTLSDVMTDLLEHALGTDRSTALQAVSARTLVQRCVEDWQDQCEEKGLTLRLDLPDDTQVTLDPVQVTRILHNLMSNAVRYTPRGGIHVCAELAADELRLRVADSGIGIAPENVERIFDEFYRTAEARQVEKLGTGLGLATVRRLTTLAGGRVSVRSVVGTGTTFEVALPCRRCE